MTVEEKMEGNPADKTEHAVAMFDFVELVAAADAVAEDAELVLNCCCLNGKGGNGLVILLKYLSISSRL